MSIRALTANTTKLSFFIALAFGLSAPTQAAYYVEDDAPEPYVRARSVLKQPDHTRGNSLTTFAVPFFMGRETLGPLGRQSVTSLLAILKAAPSIIIQGRPDSYNPRNADLAHRRALNIRSFMRAQGIKTPIKVEVVTDFELADTPNVFNVTIILPPAAPPEPPPRTVYYPTGIDKADDSIPAETVRRIMKIASEQNLSLTDATKLLLSGLPGAVPAEAAGTPLAPLRTATGDGSLPIALSKLAVPTMPARRQWWLQASKTLRDNLEQWAKDAGWNPIQWAASNYYEVTNTVPVDGDFPDVLRQVADATGLNICVRRSDKTIKVTEGHTSCKK